ncbi:MAG TPA: Qat anti-phage system QueC-like protein QatC [Gemmataceae bacterium]|jgi:7-cyano-7-deazaguanine synthase in queuosine biosynthesis
MSWHVICHIGLGDAYNPGIAATDPRFTLSIDAPGASDAMRSTFGEHFREELGGLPSGAAADLLNLATAVFAADVCIFRRFGEARWGREITIHLPVEDSVLWNGAAAIVTELLGFLSGDKWSLKVRSREPDLYEEASLSGERPEVVSLFSGGLDSLVGVLDLLAAGRRVALVGHYGAGMTHTYQGRVAAVLEGAYSGRTSLNLFHAQPPVINGLDGREPTMRSRSFLFFALGIAVASRIGGGVPLFVPENGVISLNVPLTVARSGSLSTRTTHPYYVARFQELLNVLGLDHPLVLPYRFKTKGEMLSGCADQATLGAATPLTMSCAHSEGGRWEGSSPGVHCGYCYPCLIRRAATTAAGTADSTYTVDVRTDPPGPTTRKGRDFRALSMAIERYRGRPANRALFDVLDSGPVPPDEIAAYAEVYRKGMDELADFLN